MTRLLEASGRHLDRLLATAQQDARLPSVVGGVVRNGDLAWFGERGRFVDLAGERRGTTDTQYKIGSVTKTMTAALILLARERGELDLADPVRRFLPDGPFADATIRMLLSHSAGLTAEPHGTWWERTDGGDRSALVAAHTDAAPVLEPGSQFHYSNLGFGVLGEIVAEISGASWYDTLRAEVLDPLGMARTTYVDEAPAAQGFSVVALTGELSVEPLPDTGAMAPAGQLWSTVSDLATWLTALVDPDRSVLSASSLEAMRTPQVGAPEDRSGTTWGLGLTVLRDRGRVLVGHGGSMPGFVCGVSIDVDAHVGAIVLSNGSYGLGDVSRRLVEETLQLEPSIPTEWEPTTQSLPSGARELLGVWHWGNAPSQICWRDGQLVLDPVSGSGRSMAFVAHGADCWLGVRGYLRGETLRPIRRDDASISHLECATFVYTRTPYDPDVPVSGGHREA